MWFSAGWFSCEYLSSIHDQIILQCPQSQRTAGTHAKNRLLVCLQKNLFVSRSMEGTTILKIQRIFLGCLFRALRKLL